jgi:hypothetical protein
MLLISLVSEGEHIFDIWKALTPSTAVPFTAAGLLMASHRREASGVPSPEKPGDGK